ncbi:MAG: cobalamin biosynthesis protein [Candidatus Omnitrophota bacterium]|nr:cobalamin biosynthesis protein [Candidatus Omnitrophota bacterium]
MKITTKLWIGIVMLIVLSPLGLLLPKHFKAGVAWGEWSSDELYKLIGYVPKGLEKLSSLWRAPIPEYVFGDCKERGLAQLSLAYIVSAGLGIVVVILLVWFIGRMLIKK